MDTSPLADDLPPHGTAIVRPLRHVRAVRERYMLRFTDPAQAAASRSARAWAWALGEMVIAPVTDQRTATPPSRRDIYAEIAVADERRLHEDTDRRADAAATILRWLIGDDDHVPVHCDNPGELVGGSGDVVRSHAQVTDILTLTRQGQQQAAARIHEPDTPAEDRSIARQDAEYLDGVAATLSWILGGHAEAPVTRARRPRLTTRDLKRERLHAEDAIQQARYPWMAQRNSPASYGRGVTITITWLLGGTTAPPVDPAGRGPYHPDSDLPAMRSDAQIKEAHRF